MLRFSQRMGLTPVRDVVQTDAMDEVLRMSLWNVQVQCLWDEIRFDANVLRGKGLPYIYGYRMWQDYFKQPLDTLPWAWKDLRKAVYDYISQCPWYEVYDFIEFLATNLLLPASSPFVTRCNAVLERELSGYRFVGTLIAPITSEQEIAAIEQAVSTAEASTPLNPIAIHLQQAVASLADRTAPDFRNSMKESISAVEALCKLITGDDKATLGKALNQIESKRLVPIHPQIKAAFQSLYNYTSDAGGIRHALKDEPDVELEDATFMLVTCSAFVNYMVEKARKAGIAL